MQISVFQNNSRARHGSRGGFAGLREMIVLVALVCAVIWGLDGAQQTLKLQKPCESTAPLPVHGLTVDDDGEHLWVLRRRDGLGRVSLPDLQECDFVPVDLDLSSFALCSVAGQTCFACVRLNGMVEIHVDGRRVVEHSVFESKGSSAAMAISNDGRVIVAATNTGSVHRWRRNGDEFQHDVRMLEIVAERLSLDQTGRFLALLSNRTEVCVWDLELDTCRSRWELGHSFCSALSLSRAGDRLASVGSDRRVKVWRAQTGRLLWEREADPLDPFGVSFSPCGRWLVTGGFDKCVRIWDADTGCLAAEHAGHRLPPRVFAWSADSRTVFSSGLDGDIHAWQAPSPRTVQALQK